MLSFSAAKCIIMILQLPVDIFPAVVGGSDRIKMLYFSQRKQQHGILQNIADIFNIYNERKRL